MYLCVPSLGLNFATNKAIYNNNETALYKDDRLEIIKLKKNNQELERVKKENNEDI